MHEDTIAAIATAPGEAGIAVIRISGPRARAILTGAFRPMRGFGRGGPKTHKMYYGHIVDGSGAPIDEALAVFMRAPGSYTREDVAELQCHGGNVAAARALNRALDLGARPARPGEFTLRAFENGRVSLTEAEAVMALISARSDAAARAAVRQMRGGAASFVSACRAQLIDGLALIEASIDFPDEIDAPEALEHIAEVITSVRGELLTRADPDAARIIREGLNVAIVGRPNVGKSSLMNALAGASRAIVTEVPGTTRDVLREQIRLGGALIELNDTAGQRESVDAIEREGVRRARDVQDRADVVLLIISGAEPLTGADRALMGQADARHIIILSKSDLPRAFEPDFPHMALSAETGAGMDALRGALKRAALRYPVEEDYLTQARHIDLARRAADVLGGAERALTGGAPLDVVSIDLREAARLLGELTGEDAAEDVIDAVFSNFCVGK